MVACAEANELPRDVSLDGLHQAPEDLNAFTKNIIKLYKPTDSSPDSFVKQQCMHCLDPACVAACPFKALWKNDGNGVVDWEPSRCIGCRYCEIACPYHVPKFEWDRINPKIVKCELCRPRLAKGYEPACTSVCPTHAVIFGSREGLLTTAMDRIAQSPDKYFENRVYGEHEAGGTQVLYLSSQDPCSRACKGTIRGGDPHRRTGWQTVQHRSGRAAGSDRESRGRTRTSDGAGRRVRAAFPWKTLPLCSNGGSTRGRNSGRS